MSNEKIRIFVGVPGIGKTYLCNTDNRFIDFDKIKAMYKYDMFDKDDRYIEEMKGKSKTHKRSEKEVVEYISEKIDYYYYKTDKYLLFAPNPEIVQLIYKKGLPYCLVYHSKSCVQEIRQRMRNRGNNESFINSMLDPIDDFYKASCEDKRPSFKIELKEGEYLSQSLYKYLDLNN